MKKLLSSVVAFLLAGSLVLAADVGTVVQDKGVQGPVVKTTFTWTSGTNNDSVVAAGDKYVRGELLRVVFIPSATAAPTGAYTVVATDQSGIDVLAGKGTALSTNITSNFKPGVSYMGTSVTNIAPIALNDIITIAVTNCGNSKSGQVIFYTR